MIRPITLEHISRYGEIYAAAFSGPPWNDPWKPEKAEIHVREILESKQSYGQENVVDGQVVGFLLGASMLFHYGRTFEINDLAVDPAFQGRGIATELHEMYRRHEGKGHGGRKPDYCRRRHPSGFLREAWF